MEFFTTKDNIKINYELIGEGTPIIFIHGFTATKEVFNIPKRLFKTEYKIIQYDLRGHGVSEGISGDLTIERLAIDLKEIIEYLKLKDPILVGWSLGASIILEYINKYGDDNLSKLILVDMSPKIINDSDWKLGLYHGKYTITEGKHDVNNIEKDYMTFGRSFINKIAPYFNDIQFNIAMEKMKKNSPLVMESLWKDFIYADYRNVLENINIPVLIIMGGNSTLYSKEIGEYLKSNIKDSKLIVLEQNTHLLVLENPIGFTRVLKEFI